MSMTPSSRRSSFPAPRSSAALMSGALARKVASAGALVIPARPELPFEPFRTGTYRAGDLLKGYSRTDPSTYQATPDWQCYTLAMGERVKRKRADLGIDDALFLRLHDLAIEDALGEYLRPCGGRGGETRGRDHGRSRSRTARESQGPKRRLDLGGCAVHAGGLPGLETFARGFHRGDRGRSRRHGGLEPRGLVREPPRSRSARCRPHPRAGAFGGAGGPAIIRVEQRRMAGAGLRGDGAVSPGRRGSANGERWRAHLVLRS